MKSKILQNLGAALLLPGSCAEQSSHQARRSLLQKTSLSIIGLCLWSLSSIAQNYNVTTTPQCNNTAGGNETIVFTGATPTAVGNGTLTAYFRGDLDLSTEYIDFYGETPSGPILGVGSNPTQCNANYDSIVITIPMADINTWAADGTINFLADASSAVSASTCYSPAVAYCVYMKLEYPRASGLNDIGIASVDSPGVFCAGPQDIWVTVQNYGLNQVDTFTVNWTWNGFPQPPLNLYQLLDTAQGLNPTSLQIMLGSKTITDADTLVVWTSNPENGSDTTNINDTITRIFAPALMGTYDINSAVATGGANFQTFTDFANAINTYGICSPVVINVATGSGPYNEQITLSEVPGNSSTNTITINGNGAVLTMSSPSAASYATLGLDGTDYVTVNNLTIEALGSNGFGVHMMNSADNNTFNNCTITAGPSATGTTSACVSMSGSPTSYSAAGTNGMNNSFNNCSLTGGYFGFVFYGTAQAGNTGNNIINCTVKEYYVYGAYMLQQGSATISGNTFERPTRASTSTFYGAYLTTGCTNMLVEKNRIRNPFTMQPTSTSTAYGIYCLATSSAGNENKIFNNVISDFDGNGTHGGIYLSGATHIQVYHNTISFDNPNATAGTTYGIYASGTAGVDIKNNNISITKGGMGTKYALYFSGAGKTSNNNNLYIAPGPNNFVGYYSTGFVTLANWQGANSSAWDQNSMSESPIFANAATYDYTPANSLLDNLGTPTSVTTDLLNTARSATTPDIGAYEFTVPPCLGTPAQPTASINGATTATICAGNVITLSMQGYAIGAGITYQWESSPVGQNNWLPVAGATSPTSFVTMSGPMDFRAAVTCLGSTSYSTNVVTANLNPFYICYCGPNTGVVLQTSAGTNYTTNVTVQNTPLNSSTPMGAGGYTFNDPSIATNTGTLFIGSPYTVNLTQSSTSTSINSEMWIDWNQNGTFEASEYYTFTPNYPSSSATTTVTPPAGALTGMTGMRIRTLFSTSATFSASGACTSITSARETEDYVITVAPTPTCFAPTALNATGITTSDITVNWTGSVSMPVQGYDYYYNTTGVAPTASTTPSGSVVQGSINATITGLPPGTPHYFWVRSNCGGNDYSIWAGPLQASTLIVNDEASGALPLTVNPDYNCGTVATGTTIGATQSADVAPTCNPTGINDDVWYSFVATATEHRVTLYGLNAVMSVALYEGSIGSLTQVSGACAATTAVATAANLYAPGLTIGNTYYVRVYTNVATTTTTSNFTICVGTLNATPPVNDDCLNSIDISNQQLFNGTQASATQSIASCNAVANANDVWYHFTTGASGGSVTVNVISTYADMVIEALSGTCGGTMTGMIPTASTTASGSCLDGPAIGTEFGTYTVAPFTTYYVRVYGFTNPINNDQGTFTIQVTGTPLAVKLSDITAVNVGSRNRVDWSTAAEASGDVFEVQRSIDGRNYSTLATINAKGTASTYSYWDVAPVTGKNYYRLNMKDAAGNSRYSKVVTAVVAGEGGFAISAQPNPVTSKLTVMTYGSQGKNPTISVLDVTGKVINTIDVNGTATELNMDKLAAGIYLIRYTDNSRTETIRVHKQ